MIEKEIICQEIEESIKVHLNNTSKLSPKKIAAEYIDETRIKEQITVIERYCGNLNNKKILEIGSGFGMFVAYCHKNFSCQVFGLEPSADEYGSAYSISKKLIKFYGAEPDFIIKGDGENIPFPDNSFDIVYSSNVLEHVNNPAKVLAESIRVLKPGGYLQFVVQNFGSFWESHYCIFWPPYLNHFFGKIYLKLLGKNTEYLDTMQLINYIKIKKWLKPYLANGLIEIITYGEEIFSERMRNLNFSDWAGLKKIKVFLSWAKKVKLNNLASYIMVKGKAFTPLIITLQKK